MTTTNVIRYTIITVDLEKEIISLSNYLSTEQRNTSIIQTV